jgi:hypothetical protein
LTIDVGDVNGDGINDIVFAAGASGGPHIKILNIIQNQVNMQMNVIADFMAYGLDNSFSHGKSAHFHHISGILLPEQNCCTQTMRFVVAG